MSQLKNPLQQFILSYRNHYGYSQLDLAKLLDVHPTYVAKVERGEGNEFPLRFLKKLYTSALNDLEQKALLAAMYAHIEYLMGEDSNTEQSE